MIGALLVIFGHSAIEYTSTDHFCNICHVHPHVTESWKKSTHYVNKSGVIVHCVECHLPPEGIRYFTEKARLGMRDAFGAVFKDVSKIDWEVKSRLQHAQKYMYDEACVRCHSELFSLDLSMKGEDAHVYYFHNRDKVMCINCHLDVGHFREIKPEEVRLVEKIPEERKITFPPKLRIGKTLASYAETIPGTNVVFEMVAVPGGTFRMGSPGSESFRRGDEGPVREVYVDSFWMGKTEVSWDEWEVYYLATSTGEKTTDMASTTQLDGLTGPTPPYGNPGQGWGRGLRPAITMTHHAAVKYCEWLSSITNDKYRLPTEAEWEYACRGGTRGPYFFEGDPSGFSRRSWKNKIFGVDTSIIDQYVWYEANSREKTQPTYLKKANPFGLLNMLGNVKEFCLDWYGSDVHCQYAADSIVVNPLGPLTGKEHVIRGGSYLSDAADLRIAARDHTRHDVWMLTDPQEPKSVWWYSDCFDVGFRVVREYGESEIEIVVN